MNDQEIKDLAFEWATDYKPWNDRLTPQKYAEYGYEQGYRQALENLVKAITLNGGPIQIKEV